MSSLVYGGRPGVYLISDNHAQERLILLVKEVIGVVCSVLFFGAVFIENHRA